MGEVRVSELAYKVLNIVANGTVSIDEVSRIIGIDSNSLMRTVMELAAKGFITTEKRIVTSYELTEEGNRYMLLGSPEARLIQLLKKCNCTPKPGDLPSLAQEFGVELTIEEAKIAINNAAKLGIIKFQGGAIMLNRIEESDPVKESLITISRGGSIDEKSLAQLLKRGLVRRREQSIILIKPAQSLPGLLGSGVIKPARLVTSLTTELIRSGEWRNLELKEFDPSVPVPTLPSIGRHFYSEFIDFLKEIYESMGFQETYGPYIELEFWNFDALFQAQDHPAREIHDTFFVSAPSQHNVPKRLIDGVASVHENGGNTGSMGWRYKWNAEKAFSLILRSQATAVSVRTLASRGDGEYRSFTIDRVFRPEVLDAKHSMEFHQADGIIVGKGLTFKHLLGFHEEFARRLGMKQVMFRPSYFPFTSPSAEIYMLHDKLGWIEVGGTGIFRPEVLEPLGIRESTVLAFGMGVDRLAMVVMGVGDIRDLLSPSIEYLTESRSKLVKAIQSMT
ncbi:MAG: phenylalanine--tRNA ligase subunit alpha [Thermocladium sp.]